MAKTRINILSENERLRERLEISHQRLATLERRLRDLARETGLQSVTVEALVPVKPSRSKGHPVPKKLVPPDSGVWPRAMQAGSPLVPTPGLSNLTMSADNLPVVGISVCGFGRDDLEKVVELVASRQASEAEFIPVFLTNSFDTDVFRRYGFVFEYFPMSPGQRKLDGTTDWGEYAKERLTLVKRKYNMANIITFGRIGFAEH